MRVTALAAAMIAAGLGFGMQAATAQNVHSDQDKARVEQQTMQNKDADQATGTQQSGDQGQSAAQRNDSNGDMSADRSQTNDQATKDMKAHDQSKADDEMARAESGKGKQQKDGVPNQSESTIGHPKEATTTGQGQGVRQEGSASTSQNGSSDQGSSAQGSSAQGSSTQGSSDQGSSADTSGAGNSAPNANSGNPTRDPHSVPADTRR